MQNYQKLENQSKRISRIGHANLSLLGSKRHDAPGELNPGRVMAELSLLMHELIHHPQMREWFDGASRKNTAGRPVGES